MQIVTPLLQPTDFIPAHQECVKSVLGFNIL